jgi:hypothetical protein
MTRKVRTAEQMGKHLDQGLLRHLLRGVEAGKEELEFAFVDVKTGDREGFRNAMRRADDADRAIHILQSRWFPYVKGAAIEGAFVAAGVAADSLVGGVDGAKLLVVSISSGFIAAYLERMWSEMRKEQQ